MAAIGSTLAAYIKQNYQELAMQAGVAPGMEDYKKFGDALYAQWMDYINLQQGSSPALTLTKDGLGCAPVKGAYEAAYVTAASAVRVGG